MRMIVKPGMFVKRFTCSFCGQEEIITGDEQEICSNCGLDFRGPDTECAEKPECKQEEEPESPPPRSGEDY